MTANMSIKVRIWVDKTGRVSSVKLDGTTRDQSLDAALQNEALTGLQLQSSSHRRHAHAHRHATHRHADREGQDRFFRPDFMFQEKYVFRRCIWLLATVWCATATNPAMAGRPSTPVKIPLLRRPRHNHTRCGATVAHRRRLPAQLAASDLIPNTEMLAKASQADKDAAISRSPNPSENVTINLINRLVERNILTKQDAQELIRQAQDDAAVARAQADAMQHDVAVAQEAAQMAVQQTAPPPTDDQVRVTYIPEAVKAQMREEIKEEVMAKARAENWAAPNAVPDWVLKFRVSGDIRVRYEGDFFPGGNDNTGAFPNFNSINTGAPFDVSGTTFSPQQDVDQNRTRFRIRARIGAEIDMGEGFTVGLRVGTGQDNSPVTENQTLGLANNGQGGDFSKYQLWLDRAFLKYEVGGQPNKDFSVTLGRMDNPFFDPTTIVWASDIGFDGAALQAKYEVLPGITPFFNGGAFPIFNTDFNFATDNPSKFKSEDKYLFAAQLGSTIKITKDITAKVAAGYFYFYNIEGKLSDPFTPLTSQRPGQYRRFTPLLCPKRQYLHGPARHHTNRGEQLRHDRSVPILRPGLQIPGLRDERPHRLLNCFPEPVQISAPTAGVRQKSKPWTRNYVNSHCAVNNRGSNNTTTGAVGSYAGGDQAWDIGMASRQGEPWRNAATGRSASIADLHRRVGCGRRRLQRRRLWRAALRHESQGPSCTLRRQPRPCPRTSGWACGG